MAFIARISRPAASTQTLGAIGFVAAILIVVAGNYNVQKGDNGGTMPALVTSIICLVLAAASVAVTGRSATSPARPVVAVQAFGLIAALLAVIVTLAQSDIF